MKAPIKPAKPSKPYPPIKDKATNQHYIDISHLFMKDVYYDADGNEVTEQEYDEEDGEYETTEFTPSLKSIISSVPDDTQISNIFFELNLGYDSGRNYVCRPFENIRVFYTTPYDYKQELDRYNDQLNKYNKDLDKYNIKMIQYKLELEKYRVNKKKLITQKKKAELQAQLATLEE